MEYCGYHGKELDMKVTIYPTQAPEDAIHKVEVDAEKYDLVVCSGGTVHLMKW